MTCSRIRNGKTVEVLNTDAEGRLILADALSLGREAKPDAIVDLATLTGACVVALGEKIAGLMGNDDDWSAQVRDAADRAGEAVWPLPLPTDYQKQLDSEVADLRTSAPTGTAVRSPRGSSSRSSSATCRGCTSTSRARRSLAATTATSAEGGTGFGVRTLAELARSFEPPKRPTCNGDQEDGEEERQEDGEEEGAARG